MIFVSTGGFIEQPAWKTSEQFYEYGIKRVELSGGASAPMLLDKLKSLKPLITFQLHNYFPPPNSPFVFNLASPDYDIGLKSLQHVETAMQWAHELNRPIYSFHAGFLLDPQISELGKKVSRRRLYNRHEAMRIFLERVNFLANRARSLGVELLIENNVLSKDNAMSFQENPFLMITADECVNVMQQTPDNVNLLIDVAHLKVSAKSLCFDPVHFLECCDFWIRAYHLSDNNGLCDDNEKVSNNSWFWPYLNRGLDYYSLEVYNEDLPIMVQQYELTSQQLGFFDGSA